MSLRVKEFITIACFIAFIVFVSTRDNYGDVSVDSIFNELESEALSDGMVEFSGLDFKRDFGFNTNDYEGVVYYGHETIMETETLLIIKLADESQGATVIDTISGYNEDNMELFKSYAPEQYELLKNSVLEQKGNYILYTVSDNAQNVEKLFTKAIKE